MYVQRLLEDTDREICAHVLVSGDDQILLCWTLEACYPSMQGLPDDINLSYKYDDFLLKTNKQTNRPMKNAIVASLYNGAKVWPSFAVYLYICYTVRPPHSIFPLHNPAILSIIELNTAVKMPNKSMFIEHCGAITSPLWQPHWKWQPQTFC